MTTEFIRDEVFRIVSERDLTQVDEFTIAQEITQLLRDRPEKNDISQESIDAIVSDAVNEWLLDACGSRVPEKKSRRLNVACLAEKSIFVSQSSRCDNVRVTSRRARPVRRTEEPSESDYSEKKPSAKARRPQMTHWIQCDTCDKWRALKEDAFKMCETWDSFSCGKLVDTTCNTPCDDENPPAVARTISEDTLKWVCCDRCDKWRPVDDKSFQMASSFKGKFLCRHLGISCDMDSDADSAPAASAIELPSGAISAYDIDHDLMIAEDNEEQEKENTEFSTRSGKRRSNGVLAVRTRARAETASKSRLAKKSSRSVSTATPEKTPETQET